MESFQTKVNKLCLYSLLLLSAFIFHNSASIYYEKPSFARLAAASQKPPACTYQNVKYQHGQQVITQEPCLNCTCRKGVLLCFLRVCPSLAQTNPNDNCQTVREPGECCPTLKCLTLPDISNTTPTIPTTKSMPGFSQTVKNNSLTNGQTVSNGPNPTTESTSSTDNNSINYYSDLSLKSPAEKSIEGRVEGKVEGKVSITQKDRMTTIFQTSPSTTIRESLLMVTSSPTSTLDESEENLIINSDGTCHLNGTVYAEGSAVISTSFCEYCYCIRSKRMCIRPRCHLSILGCLPRYTSEYACCPTSYVCGEEALTTLPMTTTTTTTTTTTESTRAFARKAACIINGNEYKVGEPIASDEHCMQCYCSTGGIKKCKKIQCSPDVEGCVPIIPDGHCCPVEYKCNSSLEMTKSSTDIQITTDSIGNIDSEQTISAVTEQNVDITDTILNTNDIIPTDLSIESGLESNETINLENQTEQNYSNSTNLSANDELINSLETITPSDVTNNKTTEITDIQTENTINGQQLRSDDMVLKIDDQKGPVNKEYDEIDIKDNIGTETFTSSVIETTTGQKPNKNYIKPDLYSENEINIENPTTINLDQILVTTENSINSVQNNSTEKSDQIPDFVKSFSSESLNVFTETPIISNEMNSTKQLPENETALDSVGLMLQGIIHAIDKQLKRRIPAEPRLKNNTLDEIPENKTSNDPNSKSVMYRSESKPGPSLSSSFFITDDNEPPYKSDSDGVEIITAKTAFYDLHENPGDSILINLTPSSLKVSASPFNKNNSPSSDKNFDVIGQNNRAAIYGRPANPFPQPYLQSNNDWRAVSSDFPRKPSYEGNASPPKPIESLYYNQDTRRQDTDESYDQNHSDIDKRPRLDFDGQMDPNRMKVIPFKVNDAVGGPSPKRKNGSFLIRVSSPNKNGLSPDLSSKSNQQISCFFNNMEFPNGAMIPKSDPCTLCRCFYGRELCQQQKCPAPPEKDCVPEKMPGYCCPRYICRVIEELSPFQSIDRPVHADPESQNSSPIRKSPQFIGENKNNLNINIVANESTSHTSQHNSENILAAISHKNTENTFDDKNINDENKRLTQAMVDSITSASRYTPVTINSTPKPYQRISGHNAKPKPNENRVHFPNENSKEGDSVVSQPIIPNESVPSFIQTNSRPSKPIISGSHNTQYNGANKFRLKPGQTPVMTQSVAHSPFGNNQMPNMRLPPFLLPPSPNSVNNHPVRQKPSTTPSTTTSDPQLEVLIKLETNNKNNISLTDSSQNVLTLNTNQTINIPIEENVSLSPEYHSTSASSSIQSNHSLMASLVTTVRTTPIPTPISSISTVQTVVITSSKPKESVTTEKINGNKHQNQNTWDLLRVSSCNIYGTMYEIDAQIDRLSTSCKKCICSVHGVKCTDIC